MKLNTTEEVIEYGMGLRVIQQRYERWLQTVVAEVIEDEILHPLWDMMRAHGYSEKIIEGTDVNHILREGKKVKITVSSVYNAVNPDTGAKFDVAKARENGTTAHWIEPKKKSDPLGLYQDGPDVLHWVTEWGNHAFSKGHTVGGIPASHLVRDIVKVKKAAVKVILAEKFATWKDDIFNK